MAKNSLGRLPAQGKLARNAQSTVQRMNVIPHGADCRRVVMRCMFELRRLFAHFEGFEIMMTTATKMLCSTVVGTQSFKCVHSICIQTRRMGLEKFANLGLRALAIPQAKPCDDDDDVCWCFVFDLQLVPKDRHFPPFP